MTVEVEVFLVCDDCGCRAETRTSLATMARLRTIEDGWALARSHKEDAEDYCPDCAQKRGLPAGL